MANITEKTALGATPANGDKLYIVDVSDTTDNANGSDKHVVFSDLVGHLLPLAGGTMTGDINMGGNNIDSGGVVFLTEQAAADADVIGDGQIWVKTATPNELWFTDDAGTDHQVVVPTNTVTLTNKTIDGDNNTISNLDIGNEVDWPTAGDVTDRTAFASGDKLLIQEAGVGLRKIDYDDLPGAGGSLNNVVEDTTPQLGGQLDVNGQAIGDGTNELLTFTEDASAVNHVNIENEATGGGPIISSAGDDLNSDLNLQAKGTGDVAVRDPADNTKVVKIDASSITTATTRTLTMADADVDLANMVTASSTNTFTNKTFDANGTGNSLSNVDVADLANGTDGELITWDAAGAPATVTTGTANQVLTSNGAGAAPTFQDAAGGGQTLYTTIVDAAGGGDDTDLDNAVMSASAGDTIFVRAGSYTLSQNLSPTVNNLTVIGENWEDTVVTMGAWDFNPTGSFQVWRDMKFIAGTGNWSASSSTQCQFERLKLTSTANTADITAGGNENSYDNCYFYNTSTGSANHMTASGANTRFNNCEFRVGGSGTTTNAMLKVTAGSITFNGCYFNSDVSEGATATFLYIQSGADGHKFNGCHFNSAFNGLDRWIHSVTDNVIINGCHFEGADVNTIEMDGNFAIISNNQITMDDAGAVGINVDASDCVMTGNRIECTNASPTGNGISLAGDDNVVVGNRIHGFDYGVEVASGNRNNVSANALNDNDLGSVNDSGTGTITSGANS